MTSSTDSGAGSPAIPGAGALDGAHACGAIFASPAWQQAWSEATVEPTLAQRLVSAGRVVTGEPLPQSISAVELRLLSESPFWRGYEQDAGVPELWTGLTAYLSTVYAISSPLNALPVTEASRIVDRSRQVGGDWGAEALIVPNIERRDLISHLVEHHKPDGLVRLDATCRLRLPNSMDEYLGALGKSVRTELRRGHRRAEERGVTFGQLQGEAAINLVEEYVELTTASAEKHNIPALYDVPTLRAVLRIPGARLLTAEREGHLLAGIVALSADATLVLWSGGIRYSALKDYHPYTFLLYETISASIGQGLNWVDFGRGNLDFKSRRGFIPTDLWTVIYLLNTDEPDRRRRQLADMHDRLTAFLGRSA